MTTLIRDGYLLRPANEDPVRRILSPIAPIDKWWMVYRLPFQERVTITYPPHVREPWNTKTYQHELYHAREQFSKWWGPWFIPILASVFPLPVFFSGRWFLERGAYLADIKAGRRSVKGSARILSQMYWKPWPEPLMRAWFERQLRGDKDG